MTEPIPPLPDLEISGSTKKLMDQATIDHALNIIYERRPDLFVRMAERDKLQEGGPYDEFTRDFDSFLREEVKKEIDIPNLNVMTAIFWEARRRARLMYGMSI